MPILPILLAIASMLIVGVSDISAAPHPDPAPVILAEQQTTRSSDKLMLDEPVQHLPVVDDARWSGHWTDSTIEAVIVWIALMVLLTIAGRSWARLLFRSFPDAGQGFTRILLLVIAGWFVWFSASFRIIEFRVVWVWYAILATAVIGWVLASFSQATKRHSHSMRAMIGAEGAFWIVFLIFLLFRFFNPDSWHPIWGGEKPMEFAHINAILRSAHFPPFDPWFSGGVLNYYYYGEYLVAFLIKATGIPSEIAFNLAQPTFMGLAASAIYSTVAAMSHRLSRDRIDPLVAGALGVLIFGLMGNLVAAWTLLRTLPDRPVFSFAWTWDASRAIDGGITEFPYFTGLYGDLHAHLIALPITILVLALGFALATEADAWHTALPKLVLMALSLATLSAANMWDLPVYSIMVLAAIFLWSATRFDCFQYRINLTLIAAVGVGVLAYLMSFPFHRNFVTLFDEIGRVSSGTDLGQFTLHFGGLLGILGISIAISGVFSWSSVRSRWRLLAIVGFIVTVVGAIGWQLTRPGLLHFDSGSTETIILALIAAGSIGVVLFRAGTDAYFAALAVIVAVIGMAYVVALGWPVLGIGLLLAATGALIYFSFVDETASYFGLILAAAGSVIAGAELVFVVDDLVSLADWYRMNTIFKLYYGVWTMLSILAAVALTIAIYRKSASFTSWSFTPQGFSSITEFRPAPRSALTKWGLGFCGLLIGLSLIYPVVATAPRLDERFSGHPGPGSLDALDWMSYGTLDNGVGQVIRFDDDLAAIRWFQDEVSGTPVIAEASIGPYRGDGSRFSIALGLPAVLGWDRHERQQRYQSEIALRNQDVRDLYDSIDPNRKRTIIEHYTIDYIIVGDVERLTMIGNRPYASAAGIAALESMDDLEIVFQQGSTVVYKTIRTGTT